MNDSEILVVGAGPVGMVAALELVRRGRRVTIIDREEGPAVRSRAFGVNPQTLRLLADSGATETLIRSGVRIKEIRIHSGDTYTDSVPLSIGKQDYPFMLGIPQSRTEEILAGQLQSAGVAIRWGTELIHIGQASGVVSTTIRNNEREDDERYRMVVACDGAHSTVRKGLGIAFDGEKYPGNFHIADVILKASGDEDFISLYLFREGMIFRARIGDNHWRLASNMPDYVERINRIVEVSSVEWTSDFSIHHRIASTFQQGNVFLAGDAAHIHSPLGARGMNLGIEDAVTLARLIANSQQGDYAKERKRKVEGVVDAVRTMTRFAVGQSGVYRFFRMSVLPSLVRLPFIQSRIARVALGELP